MSRAQGRNGESYRIGLIADTHDADSPLSLVTELARQRCDHNIHLGDIGGSPSVMRVVREFKRHLGGTSHLPRGEQAQFQRLLGEGKSRLSAFIETRLGDHDRTKRIAETTMAYRAVLDGMAQLGNPILLRGNVDGQQLANPLVRECFADGPLQLVERPGLLDLGWLGIILWPSWRPADAAGKAQQAAMAEELAVLAARKELVVVAAHEHCLKGPSAARYAQNVAQAGLAQRSIPRFDPNHAWRCLLRLFRRLPPELPCYYVFGHVHDPLEVIAAGAPALRNREGPGLRYRLYGLSWRGDRPQRPTGRRSIVQLPVGVDEVAVCEARRRERDVRWTAIRSETVR